MKVFKISQVFLFIILIALHESISKYIEDDGTIVQLEEGKIRGHILKSLNGNDYYAFQEIPYAAPPVGENRFQLAKPPKPWTDVLNTTRNTKICYQKPSPYTNLELSEDCLYINVYTPQKPGSNNLLPVLLWIHGGAFVYEAGTIEYFGPKYVIDSGIVVVTFNYRLGAFGFVGTNDGVIPLNIGLKDQRWAMEWVQKNIHLFGGDPDHVTIAGESSGSLAVDYHLTGPWEDGKQLFHAAIMQSGSILTGLLVQDHETNTALSLGRALDPEFKSDDTKELLNVLQKAEATDIFKLQASLTIGTSQESEGPFSYNGFEAFLSGNYKNVPVLSGFTSEEAAGDDADAVAHGEDTLYFWANEYNSDLSKFPEADQLTLHKFVKLLTNFVKFYNPTPEVDPLLDNVIWQPSEPISLRFLNINGTLSMQENPRQFKEVNEIMEKYMQPPFVVFG
ncbi:juvenile hormone esterase-like isoform X2 [Diabrotica undecimpunctata]|uniref:juvenile hormone esterase-like isoform X2 n=1 Tax=Diabrotica undecimpunctata TaxID=50387 RepID=UPI003B638B65